MFPPYRRIPPTALLLQVYTGKASKLWLVDNSWNLTSHPPSPRPLSVFFIKTYTISDQILHISKILDSIFCIFFKWSILSSWNRRGKNSILDVTIWVTNFQQIFLTPSVSHSLNAWHKETFSVSRTHLRRLNKLDYSNWRSEHSRLIMNITCDVPLGETGVF